MGTFGGGERYDDNPFIYFESEEYIIQPQQKQDMPNPLRAMYEDIAPLLLRSLSVILNNRQGGKNGIF